MEMGYEFDAFYGKTYLLPPSIDDWVEKDHPVRFVRELVDSMSRDELGLKPGTERGRPAYSESLLLKLWLFGYLNGITSSRKLEQACWEYVPVRWLAGEHRPDHNTLWRFWSEQRELIERVFAVSVQIAVKAGLVGMALHALDGTKIHAWGSTRQAYNREQLEDKLGRLDELIERIGAQVERSRAEEANEQADALSAELQDRQTLRALILEELNTAGAVRKHRLEPEARVMMGCGLGYNAQTVVDEKASVIVAADVRNDQNDTALLVPMIEQVQSQMGAVAEQNVADAGYNTAEALEEAEQKGFAVLLGESNHESAAQEDPYHSVHFVYDSAADLWSCPQNKKLRFERERPRRGQTIRIYRGESCGQCPVRSDCTSDRKGRSIELSSRHAAVARHREKRNDPQKRELLEKRLYLAERPFAVIKHLLRFRRFKSRGLRNARSEWLFICAVFNIKLLLGLWRKQQLTFA